jgi:predicted Zn-dependent protease
LTHFYRSIVLAVRVVIAQAAIISVAIAASPGLPNLGDASDMSPSAERRLGDRIARELYRDPDYLDDPVTMEYVQAIWQPLLAAARLRGELPSELDDNFAWEILLGRDRTVNAFALPGAYFGLHLGLVGAVTSRDELASVMAHELSHVTQRHISRLISRQSGQAPWLMGAMILGALAASKNPGAAQAVIVGGQAVAAQTQLNFSRDMEREADRVGFGVLTQAGFEAQGFVGMFEKLQQASRLNDTGGFPYLRSHPLTTERLSDMQARIPASTSKTAAFMSNPAGDMVQAMVAARARVLSNAAVDALQVWRSQADSAQLARLTVAQQAGTLYGAGLAMTKLREFALAKALCARLAELTAREPAPLRLAQLLGVELSLAQGDGPHALAGLQNVQRSAGRSETSRAELFLQVQASLQTRQIGDVITAAQQLQTWVSDHPKDAMAWQWLASAYAAQGRTLGAIRAEAEVNVAQLDYAAAANRLKAAQDLARQGVTGAEHIEASIVDTRARQVDALLREQAVER